MSYRKDKANDALAELAEWDFVPGFIVFLLHKEWIFEKVLIDEKTAENHEYSKYY